jgi:glyoxylase-like metal-dependent hydrolase (beta-lactamase superfamily II)
VSTDNLERARLSMRAGAASRKEALERSNEMTPVQGTVDIDVPIAELWEAFAHANWWPKWNKCFFWAHNKNLTEGQHLVWAFQPIRWYYLYKMFAIANIVEVEKQSKVTWEVTAMPGFYARHTYHMEDLGGGRSRFGSWEQAMGGQIRFGLTRRFWIAHFTFVKDRSLEGARTLESIYRRDGRITSAALYAKTRWARGLSLFILLLLLLIGAAIGWFYESYVRLTAVDLVPGITAVLAGGGNSTLVSDNGQLLLIDTKFPPGSILLRRWISKHFEVPVSMIVNTHYHYDHTQGNTEYPQAAIYAYQNVPALMRKRDGDWWSKHQAAMPTNLVGDVTTIRVGSQPILLVHPGGAHTQGDLYVVVHRDDKDVVATGDIVFNTYYPMMDLGEGGMDLHGLSAAVQELARKYPKAIFVPGHGPIATSEDLRRYAAYLKSLTDSVDGAQHDGLSEDQAAARIDLSGWNLRELPTFHDNHLCWSNASMNIHWAYQLEAGTRIQRLNCTF